MKQWIAISMVAAFATGVAAQTADPKPPIKDRQKEVQAVTQQKAPSSVNTQKTAAEQAANVKASKEVAKMTTAEKKAYAMELNKAGVNPENPSGSSAGTAAMQKETTAASKAVPKQNVELKTKEGQKDLSKELKAKSTP